MTPELVAKYLRLDRAIGAVMPFVGVDRSKLDTDDEKDLDAALAELDAASTELEQAIYKQCGV